MQEMEKLGAGAAQGWGNDLDFALLSSFPAPSTPPPPLRAGAVSVA